MQPGGRRGGATRWWWCPCHAGRVSIAATPDPPYTAVVFTSLRTPAGPVGYAAMTAAMDTLAARQPGYLGAESARDTVGITVSYWANDAAAQAWKRVAAHLGAQHLGRERWYADYRVRVATVHRDYGPGETATPPAAPPPTRRG